MRPAMSTVRRAEWWAAAAGVLAAVAGVLSGELLAGLASPSLSPVSAVGSAVVDLAPPAAKEWAIQTFGTNDKAFLITAIPIALVALGATAGLLELRRSGAGAALATLIGVVGIAAVATRSLSSTLAIVCAVVAAAVAIGLIRWLVPLLRTASETGEGKSVEQDPSRRRFLHAMASTAAALSGPIWCRPSMPLCSCNLVLPRLRVKLVPWGPTDT